ncbi:MAG TPA: ferredoxin [Niabella sp.]|nr:ferredoxin [Niabella sp.]HOZ96111.1 ferredoxin [Niabella sp.]HQW13477.1 ferredoxin [Niabella sp.]HQX18871.1 ferredoxin [Niabella sp.]HQX41551.1 ferredoxin [Niabella sp.]
MSKLVHYRDKCIGCGICYEMQPDYWRMSTRDGKATLVKAEMKKKVHQREIMDWDVELAQKLAHACPVKVIKIM